MNKNNLPNNLYELRRKAGLSQEDFAERLGVSRQAVSKWERGEAYPDTENLIVISEMFSVTIDDLLRAENVNSDTSDSKNESTNEEDEYHYADTANDGGFHVNVGNKVKLDLNGEITVDDEDTKVKIDFDNGDITVNDDDGQVKVGFGNGGITVNSDDGVKVKLGKRGIEIHNSDDDDDEDDDTSDGNSITSILNSIPYPIVTTVAFLALGLFFGAWYWAWTLFMTIPIYYSLISAIRKRRFSNFAYPVFAAFLYCLFGMLFGIWHPGWLIFVTIPIYYPIAEAIDRYNRKNK